MNEDFWKQKYQDRWGPASEREAMVARLLENETGCTVVAGPGLGAGSAEYLPGAARRHGAERGGADLHVVGTDVYVEVTGPLKPGVGPEADLWIRPDKIESARSHPERDNWVVHALHDNETLRVIHLDAAFERAYEHGRFETVTPTIQGAQERYVAVPASSGYVEPIGILVDYLRRRFGDAFPPRHEPGEGEPAESAPPPERARPAPQPPAAAHRVGPREVEAAPASSQAPAPAPGGACPACGSQRLARIVYGNIRVTAELERDMDAGLVEFGGLGEYDGMPTWRCLDCQTLFGPATTPGTPAG